MKKSIMRKWVAALRSGKYKQGRDSLRQNDKYCCLGVLCDISKKSEWERITVNGDIEYFKYAGSRAHLPVSVGKWAGISTYSGYIPDVRMPDGKLPNGDPLSDGVTLTKLNDLGYDFNQIANVIERYYERI